MFVVTSLSALVILFVLKTLKLTIPGRPFAVEFKISIANFTLNISFKKDSIP